MLNIFNEIKIIFICLGSYWKILNLLKFLIYFSKSRRWMYVFRISTSILKIYIQKMLIIIIIIKKSNISTSFYKRHPWNPLSSANKVQNYSSVEHPTFRSLPQKSKSLLEYLLFTFFSYYALSKLP